VVHNAADEPAVNVSAYSSEERSKSIVYMGSFMPYKNVETLVKASSLLPDFTLHLLSRISDSDRARLSSMAPGARIEFHNGTSDEEYVRLLSTATALVSASRDEGFGIPLVEAMSLGTPIVVSDIDIFHEIGGGAALYAPADDAQAFADAILSLSDQDTWNRVAQKSREQAALFSWKKSATELFDVLVKVSCS
jgi:glycosyltransferase involved in cell wall biosynthesis